MKKINKLLGIAYECPIKPDSLIHSALVPLLIDESDNVTLLSYSSECRSKYKRIISHYKKDYNIKLIIHKKRNSPIRDIIHIIKDVYLIRKNDGINTFHCRSYLPSLVGLLFKILYRDKYIFDPRGVLAEELSYDSKDFSKFYIYFINWIERYLLLMSYKNIFVSIKMKDFYIAKHNINLTNENNIRYIYSNRGRFKLPLVKPSVNCIKLCYVGSTNKYQMIREMTDLLSNISAEINFSMTFFIPKNSNSLVDGLCKGKGFQYKIENISNEKVALELPKFHYGFLLRGNHILNKVASPVKFYEYISTGLRVISTKYVGDYSDLIQTNNLGVIVDIDQDQSAKGIQDINAYVYNQEVFKSFLDEK